MAIHPSSIVLSKSVPVSTEVGPFTLIGEDVFIGKGVIIGSHVMIGTGVKIEDNATIEAGVRLGDGCKLEADVVVGQNAVISQNVVLHLGASISAGASVIMDVPPYAIISGNAGTISGYVDAGSTLKSPVGGEPAIPETSRVRGVKLFELPNHLDLRGNLTVGEFEKDFPFIPKRYFLVYGVSSERVRGEHAHHHCHQFLICVNGICSVIADDGYERQEFCLDRPNQGLYLPPMTWGIQYKFLKDAVLLVFASEKYEPEDYIRNYSIFRDLVHSRKNN